MNAQEHTTLRAIILPSGYQLPDDAPTNRLLMDLGHTVLSASTAEQAMRLLRDDPTDILIVDVTDSPENRRLIDQLGELPADSRPRELAIFTERSEDRFRRLKAVVAPAHVHVFLKPLHMHGLLSILRRLEAGSRESSVA
jgi:hypothetical protein